MVLDFSFAGEVLKQPTGDPEGVADGHVNIVMRIRNIGIPADYDIRDASHRKVNPHLVGVAFVVPMLRPANNYARRRTAISERLELLPVIAA